MEQNNKITGDILRKARESRRLRPMLSAGIPYLPAIFSLKRVLARLLAVWSLYVLTREELVTGFVSVGFNQKNALPQLLLYAVLGFVFLSLIAFLLPRLHTDSWLLLFGTTLCVLCFAVSPSNTDNRFQFWIAVGILLALLLVWFIRVNEALLARIRPGKKTAICAGVLFAVIAGGILAVITCLRYSTFSASTYDFGIFVNMFHNMKETGLPYTTCERDTWLSHFAVHISPIYYLLLPFYMLFPSPYTLQIGQAAVLMLGVIPVVALAKQFQLSGKVTVVFSMLYTFYAALSTGCFYDIHENCFLAPLLLLTFLFFEKQRWIPMYLCAALTLCVKEDAAVYILIFALYMLLARKKYKHGAILCVMALGYFLLSVAILEEYGRGIMDSRYKNLIWRTGDGLPGALKTFFLNPGYVLTQLFSTKNADFGKLIYFLELLLPLGFLPFCTKKTPRLLLLAPLLLNLLTMYVYQYEIEYQYSFGITAFLFYAAIQNTADLSHGVKRNLLAVALAFGLSLYVIAVSPRCIRYVQYMEENRAAYARMEEILEMLPEDASVSASGFLVPHIADRREIYDVAYHNNKTDIDYVVLDARNDSYRRYCTVYTARGYEEYFFEENKIMILVRRDTPS